MKFSKKLNILFTVHIVKFKVSIDYNKAHMVGHQLVINLAYYNNNLALQLYFSGSTTCYLEEVMMVPKIYYSEFRGCMQKLLPPGARFSKNLRKNLGKT